MSLVRIAFFVSAAFVVLPLMGIPTSWKTVAQFLLSLFLFIAAYREYRRTKAATRLF